MAVKNKVEFEVEYAGQKFKLASVKPSLKVQEQAQLVYAAAFNKFVQAGGILKQKLDAVIREQKLWDENKQKQFEELIARMGGNEQKMPDANGRVKVKDVTLKQAKEAAIQLRRDRTALRNLLMERSELESNTVEEQAKQYRFNYLVSVCTVYAESGKAFFSSHDDYLSRADDVASTTAASNFAMLYYKYDPDEEHNLPENVFLKKYKFCNEQLHLVNADGHLVDTEGRLLDDEGRFVNEAGDYVDSEGNPVDKAGDLIVETFPLLDDAGEPLKTD